MPTKSTRIAAEDRDRAERIKRKLESRYSGEAPAREASPGLIDLDQCGSVTKRLDSATRYRRSR